MEQITGKNIDEWISDQLSKLAHKPPRTTPPTKKIAIISTPRSGSTFFCESLGSTGRFGLPSEWLNPHVPSALLTNFKQVGTTLREYLNFVVARTTTDNGVFTLNFHVDQYLHWKKRNFDALSLGFDRIIFIYRRDRIAQAYSYAKALATNQWRSTLEPTTKRTPEQITNAEILKALHAQNAWDEFYLERLDKHVHARYCYEEVIADPERHFRDALAVCGIEHQDIAQFNSGLDIQRKDEDLARIREFRRYLGC